jgi:drug/metabolite transporter superfamily protein YnfA
MGRVYEKLYVRIRRQETVMTDEKCNALLVVVALLLTFGCKSKLGCQFYSYVGVQIMLKIEDQKRLVETCMVHLKTEFLKGLVAIAAEGW